MPEAPPATVQVVRSLGGLEEVVNEILTQRDVPFPCPRQLAAHILADGTDRFQPVDAAATALEAAAAAARLQYAVDVEATPPGTPPQNQPNLNRDYLDPLGVA